MQEAISIEAVQPLRIIKIGTCPTLSGKGELGYQIGCNAESEIFFRVSSNSGGGYYSPAWSSLNSILEALEKGHKPLTSFALQPLFRGKSINTPAFLFAALKAEGLVQTDEDNPRCYVAMPSDAFISEITGLIASDVDIKVPAKVTGKGVVRIKPKKTDDTIPVMGKASKGRPKKLKQDAISG